MTDIDFDDMLAKHQQFMREMEETALSDAATQIDEFKLLAQSKGVQVADLTFRYSPPLGVTASAPGLLRSLLDVKPDGRDGLFSWPALTESLQLNGFSEGTLRGNGFMALAHPSFRRQMHPMNNWAPRFVELFWALDDSHLEKFIALDEDRVRIDLDGPGYAEADTWYGPPFNRDISQIQPGNVKLRPPADLSETRVEMFFSGVYSTDVRWSDSGTIKTFQALELKIEKAQREVDGVMCHPARYMHAEFDMQRGTFRHFDGAVQYLTDAEYFARRDSDFSMVYKTMQHVKPKSKKVFKLNGAIQIDTWVELASHFFTGNPLLFEYFDGSLPPHILDLLERIRARQPS